MTDPLNTQNRVRNSTVAPDNRANATAKNAKQPAQSESAAGARKGTDSVELSNAKLIEELNEQIRNLPEVNEARVEAVKQALSNGEYQPDAEVIARKYSEIEKLLP